jgi:hypothetical protein
MRELCGIAKFGTQRDDFRSPRAVGQARIARDGEAVTMPTKLTNTTLSMSEKPLDCGKLREALTMLLIRKGSAAIPCA